MDHRGGGSWGVLGGINLPIGGPPNCRKMDDKSRVNMPVNAILPLSNLSNSHFTKSSKFLPRLYRESPPAIVANHIKEHTFNSYIVVHLFGIFYTHVSMYNTHNYIII